MCPAVAAHRTAPRDACGGGTTSRKIGRGRDRHEIPLPGYGMLLAMAAALVLVQDTVGGGPVT